MLPQGRSARPCRPHSLNRRRRWRSEVIELPVDSLFGKRKKAMCITRSSWTNADPTNPGFWYR
ncbi:MAG: hypothetical protein BWX48_02682 [Verrucomicrobia bacterium ADurb.Bin006]|jgi:hypothetical protein|nr:MAG: hypothetical protein BWX48_02682 [Verrucomicrobia bacterium ADurb.Bin006]